ncbi:MAG: Crp/Fnr family transcriptional regulator [Nitrospiraceae bacterium]|nr:Crp/Fnr family transcriptional regulator [Nitrospiraceae bacterium]
MLELEKMAIFNSLSPEEALSIGPLFIKESRKKRETIFSEGDQPQWFYIVLKGKVKITKLSQEGKEIILEVIGPNEIFGGVAVIRGLPYPANAISMEDCSLLKISREDLMDVLKKFPPVTMAIFQNLGLRLQNSHESRKEIALEKVLARVASLLLKLADKSGEKTAQGILLETKLTKQEIAEMVGTTVETSIRTMSRLKKDGIISEKDGQVLIKNMERLKELSA